MEGPLTMRRGLLAELFLTDLVKPVKFDKFVKFVHTYMGIFSIALWDRGLPLIIRFFKHFWFRNMAESAEYIKHN